VAPHSCCQPGLAPTTSLRDSPAQQQAVQPQGPRMLPSTSSAVPSWSCRTAPGGCSRPRRWRKQRTRPAPGRPRSRCRQAGRRPPAAPAEGVKAALNGQLARDASLSRRCGCGNGQLSLCRWASKKWLEPSSLWEGRRPASPRACGSCACFKPFDAMFESPGTQAGKMAGCGGFVCCLCSYSPRRRPS
jgi:hypothetical protein